MDQNLAFLQGFEPTTPGPGFKHPLLLLALTACPPLVKHIHQNWMNLYVHRSSLFQSETPRASANGDEMETSHLMEVIMSMSAWHVKYKDFHTQTHSLVIPAACYDHMFPLGV